MACLRQHNHRWTTLFIFAICFVVVFFFYSLRIRTPSLLLRTSLLAPHQYESRGLHPKYDPETTVNKIPNTIHPTIPDEPQDHPFAMIEYSTKAAVDSGLYHIETPIAPKDIRVPADMWRHPSEFPSWHPVQLPNCFPFPEDALRYYGPGMGYTPDDLKTLLRNAGGDLIMIGDSLAYQWFKTLHCYLQADLFDNKSRLEIKHSFLKLRPEWPTLLHAHVVHGVFQIPNELITAPKQYVIFISIKQYLKSRSSMTLALPSLLDYYGKEYQHEFSRGKPTFVMNTGLHYNYFEEGHAMLLREDLTLVINTCNKSNLRCIFRETSPQHFDTEIGDGLFERLSSKNRCFKDPPPSFQTLSNWRNDILHELLHELREEETDDGYVRLMPLFDKLTGLYNVHHKLIDDCVHFTFDSNIWEPWHVSLAQVLDESSMNVSRK